MYESLGIQDSLIGGGGVKISEGCDLLQLPYYSTYSGRQAWANSVDLDQMPQNAASDQGLHCLLLINSLRKHAYSNIMRILPPKNEKFQIKNSDVFHISAQNIDCGYSLEPPRRGGSNEYPQSMFLRRNRKNVYPCKPQFYYIKVGFKGSKLYRYVFEMFVTFTNSNMDVNFIINTYKV